jgi:hypothetical protein
MDIHFEKVKSYLLDLEYIIKAENEQDQIFVVEKEDAGITNLIIDVEAPLVIIEQFLFELPVGKPEVFKQLLQKNREIIHGAFVLDETGTKVIFRDTLQVQNLDLNELEASINSLSLLLSEFGSEILKIVKQ